MTGRTRVLSVLAIVGVLLAMTPLAKADVVLTLTGFVYADPNDSLNILNGFYVGDEVIGPYLITNSNDPTSTEWAVACDDISTTIPGLPYSWDATTTNPDAGAKFVGATLDGYSADVMYNAAGLLAAALMGDYAPDDPATIAAYSYAIWSIFDSGAIGAAEAAIDGTALDPGVAANALDLRGQALVAAAGGAHADSLTIYTPTGCIGGQTDLYGSTIDCNDYQGINASQEFLQASGINPNGTGFTGFKLPTPEGSPLATLGVDLFALFAGIFLLRRRILRNGGASN